jgi:hypothetical protein
MSNTFFGTHMVDVSASLVCLVMCHDGKNVSLKLIITPMAGGCTLDLVSMNQMKNEE